MTSTSFFSLGKMNVFLTRLCQEFRACGFLGFSPSKLEREVKKTCSIKVHNEVSALIVPCACLENADWYV